MTALDDAASASSNLIGGLVAEQSDGTFLATNIILSQIDLESPLLKNVLGKITFGLSQVAEQVQATKVVCLLLKTCYDMYNACSTKQVWTSEFMIYLKLIENELCLGRKEFQNHNFLEQIETVLRTTQQRLEMILARGAVASFLFSMTDQATLQESRLEIEACKEQALQGMMTEVKQDTHSANLQLHEMIATLRRKQVEGVFTTSTSSSSQKSYDVAAKQLLQLNRLKLQLGLFEDVAEITRRTKEFHSTSSRQQVKEEFKRWLIYDKTSTSTTTNTPVFVILADTGVGKTSLASFLSSTHAASIHATHMCTSILPFDVATGGFATTSVRNDPFLALKSLSMQLALRMPWYAEWLTKQLDENKNDFVEKLSHNCFTSSSTNGGDASTSNRKCYESIKKMFEDLFVRPMHILNQAIKKGQDDNIIPMCVKGFEEVRSVPAPASSSDSVGPSFVREIVTHSPKKVVLLIDGLEHMDVPSNVSSNSLLRAIIELSTKLPTWFGITILARPEEAITKLIHDNNTIRTMTIEIESDDNRRDIRDFIDARLVAYEADSMSRENLVSDLVTRSEGMWSYLNYRLDDSAGRLVIVDEDDAIEAIGRERWLPMLNEVRQRCAAAMEGENINGIEWKDCIEMIKIVGTEPISLADLMTRVSFDSSLVAPLSVHLRSLLSIDSNGRLRLVHASIRRWMMDSRRLHTDEEVDFHITDEQ